MRHYFALFIFAVILVFSSCRTDFDTVASSGNLKFSRDTVYLDTVFKNIGSSTYQLKVYNKSKDDISIPIIQLKKGLASKYRMTVDGMSGNQGKIFNNVTLLAKDSLYIFIETTADITDADPTDFLYTDEIEFDSGANLQKVALVTLIQDAIFLYPKQNPDGSKEKIKIDGKDVDGFYLEENDAVNGNELLFSNQKPYVIYGYAGVPKTKTAVFEAGSRVFFHANSGLFVDSDAALQINGGVSTTEKLEKEVIFEGDRLESLYSDIPGQWGSIILAEGSVNHSINHLTLKNATIGLDLKTTTNTAIKNTQIYNCAQYGILAENAQITGENIVINYAGLASLSCVYGGNYNFTHCTFYNNWQSNSHFAVSLSNSLSGKVPETNPLTQATFNNCIIYGSNTNELNLNKNTNAAFVYQLSNCLLKFSSSSTNPDYQFKTDTQHYNSIILNESPKFYNVSQNKFNIDKTSAAFAKGNQAYIIPVDIIGNTRTSPPDLGAYQSKDF
ncbi:right-handed parallel beta-helix repeat-containing protein [Flavobacterium reichenbachii]|uniref:Right handed beta helix domain-containing protein n=1 Tax=Flavobacterium reichenbachii TaxID=362418 RepID=A0A085ZLX4_9FLAO|nr:right-handed parallel beta-helix repeat-containing protein [Flavobacterium reichenbachii]KFF05438.1 hypothetical protein IW19_07875 [Flavobacterium reichenbachii]OXB18020.1 hypothetical protein B0A68_02215 [Flavobacterium reichenbachii]